MTQEQKKALLDRREFTSTTIMALLSGVAITVSGCSSGGGDSNPTGPSNPGGGGTGAKVGTISDNHSHTASITQAQIDAGQSITLNIRGTSDHPHTIQISMAELAQIAAGTQVSKTSSVDSSVTTGPHTHVVTFN